MENNENQQNDSNPLLSSISQFDISKLKPTTTTVRQGAVEVKPSSGRLGFSEDEDIIAYYDDPADVRTKSIAIAELIKSNKHVVVYTGAGISTSTGIPDYRSEDTGIWTLRDKGITPSLKIDIDKIRPSYGHMALAALVKNGFVSFIVSTNIDGLHLRSGIPREKLSELHGNSFLETCSKCNKEYLRMFDCTKEGCRKDHKTGRKCEVEGCDGDLLDSIVHFGENLPQKELFAADLESRKGDLALVLGTSMRVAPANELPSRVYGKNSGKLVICNLQKTPFDEKATIRVQCYTDDLLGLVCKELGVKVETNTPEGVKTHEWEDRMDTIYTDKIKEMNAKIDQRKVEPIKKLTGITLNTKNLSIRTNFTISKLKKETVEIKDVQRSQLAIISACTESNFTVTKPCTKIIILNCQDCVVDVKASVLTNFLEVINCSNITVNLKVPIYTFTVDSCKNIKVFYEDRSKMQMIITTKSENIKIQVDKEEHEIKHEKSDDELDQFITRYVNGKITTELILRECEGMFTTAREKEQDEAAAAATAEAMAKYMSGAIRITPKVEKNPKTPIKNDEAILGRLLSKPKPIGYQHTSPAPTGLQSLGLDANRDALLYVPPTYSPSKPAPFVLMLHGNGDNANGGLYPLLHLADKFGLILLAPSSRVTSWDIKQSDFGPDIAFIDSALEIVFEKYAIDTKHIAVEGFSDGGSYALSLGTTNGDLFTHVVSFSPGFMRSKKQFGDVKPPIFVSHGIADAVLTIDDCSRKLVKQLKSDGYIVNYIEFDGVHTVPRDMSLAAMDWFLGTEK